MNSRDSRGRNPIALVEENRIISLYFMGNPPCSGKSTFCSSKSLLPIHNKQT